LSPEKKEYTLRCLRCLGGRIIVSTGDATARCSHCGQDWRISWVTPDVAKIRGRVIEGGRKDGASGYN
jgi:hypothetical protein